jgi:hypothetical protein
MPQVPMLATPHTQDELAAALTAELAPLGATATTGALLLALSNQETGSASKMWNDNLGNITTADDSVDWWATKTGAAKGLHFRAYLSFDDGVRDFVRFVHSRPKLWSASGIGDLSQFAQQIRDSKYNPDLDVAGAAPTLLQFAKRALPLFSSLPAGPALTLSGGSGGGSGWGGLLLIAGLLWFGLERKSRA